MNARARRGTLVALAAALVAGSAAAWLMSDYASSLERRDGARVPVLVTTAPLHRGERIEMSVVEASVERRTVPRAFAPPGAIGSEEELVGVRPLVDVPAETQLSSALFAPDDAPSGYRLRSGERAVTVSARVSPDTAEPAPGVIVDLFAAGIGGGTSVETVVAGAELVAVSDERDGTERATVESTSEDAGAAARARAGAMRLTLRVSAQQAASLIRADAFAEDLRAVLRP